MIDQACTNHPTTPVERYRDHKIFYRPGVGYFAFDGTKEERGECEDAVELMSDDEVENDQDTFVFHTVEDVKQAIDLAVQDRMATRVDPDQ
ncbi:MAG: hypothetical protein LCH78_18205 [Proteobacteria bacterium]|nr:hypothetical protein [Pseudomonadota bacterium]